MATLDVGMVYKKITNKMYFETDNHHNNVYLILLSIGANILGYFTSANLAVIAQLIAIIGGLMAIINYTIIFYDRWRKKKEKINYEKIKKIIR